MLSRTASDLYWMSRYLERAENLARMLDVSYSLSLMPQDGRGDGLHELAMPLLITGTLEDYHERHGELHAERLLRQPRGAHLRVWCCLRLLSFAGDPCNAADDVAHLRAKRKQGLALRFETFQIDLGGGSGLGVSSRATPGRWAPLALDLLAALPLRRPPSGEPRRRRRRFCGEDEVVRRA